MSMEQYEARAKGRQRLAAALAAALMLLSVLLSVTLLLREASHDCEGPDCAVCSCIAGAVRRLTGGGELPPLKAVAAALSFFTLLLCLSLPCVSVRTRTPVSLKVKLLN